jgi:5-(carboxyamino)imidazole ribonucleotide mutase
MAWAAVLMGSESDWAVMQTTTDTLTALEIKCEVRITSAHRTPKATSDYVADAEQRGCAVFICAAGMAAHLAGAVAAQTIRPVIGVPLDASLGGLDALLSTVQMPGGIPVATVAVGKAGARNAAYLAAQILGVADPAVAKRVRADRDANAARVVQQDATLAKLRGESR